ncbi:epoxide hydrolase [Staphylococcus arlettae]|uniref:epoxide hydrolase family protein n=1 Tax=Staphylococcus arlettae TaxID=29378 RepID=UPI001E34A36E|nr:epoxide hydrolase family protein [Staphylococcus arlettae]MCD8841038.1 epoxide hydrolase [Staphylococcus arlettae]
MKRISINFSKAHKNLLRAKLEYAKWPVQLDEDINNGISIEQVKELTDYWLNVYDWSSLERHLNQFNHYETEVAGQHLHFIYEHGKTERRIPLLLLHGWPDSILRYTKVIDGLTQGFTLNGEKVSYDVIIPSLPGFGFSKFQHGVSNEEIAEILVQLMKQAVGDRPFIISGGDVGSSVARYMASQSPQALLGLHLTDVGIIRPLLKKTHSLSLEEADYQERAQTFFETETGYMEIQATKPQTLSFGISDSPVGLLAWLGEKYWAWSGKDQNGDSLLSPEDMIHLVYLYWETNCAATAANVYLENATKLLPLANLTVATGISLFEQDVMLPPTTYVKEHYNLTYLHEVAQGGHFTAMEVPKLFTNEIMAFTRTVWTE